jgi:hypothetical protein
MSVHLPILVAALMLPAAPAPPVLDAASRTALNMRVTGGALQTFLEMGGDLGLGEKELKTVDAVSEALDPEVRDILQTKDGWGNPLRLRTNGKLAFVLISYGADGLADFKYDLAFAWRRTAPTPNRDAVWTGGMFLAKPVRPGDTGEQVRQASEELQAISGAMRAFLGREGGYPNTAGLRPVDSVAEQLASASGRVVPRTDPWGQPYFIWSDGRDYLVVSGGSDARLDRAYVDAKSPTSALGGPGPAASAEEDILFVDGTPARWVGEKL